MAHIIDSKNGDSLCTPPSSSNPVASGERKRKRIDESTTSDDSISKRLKRPHPPEAHTTPQEIPESPVKAISIGEAPRSFDADLPLSPRSPQNSEARSSYQPQLSNTRARDTAEAPGLQGDSTSRDPDPEPQTEPQIGGFTSVEAGQLKALTESSIGHWVLKGTWPKEHFIEEHAMNNPLAKKRSASTLKDQSQSDITDVTGKEKEYQSPQFEILLATAGIYIDEDFNVPPSQSCKDFCSRLLRDEQKLPQDTLFEDGVFQSLTQRLRVENEAMVVRDVTPLIILYGHVNTAWGRCIPLVGSPPQPDYCAGLDLDAFTRPQYLRLRALICTQERNPLMATFKMFFPFFMCETKASGTDLDVADRQNTSSGAVAVNAVVTLYRAAGRHRELHRKILAFSIAHNAVSFKIYGHYASLEGPEPRFYRYPIRRAFFTEPEDRWTAYRFTRNLYDTFAPIHLQRILAILDHLPDNASIWNQGLLSNASDMRDSSAPQAPEPVTPSTPVLDDGTFKKPKSVQSRSQK